MSTAPCVCTKCGASKSLDEMGLQKGTKTGRHAWCKECLRNRKRAARNDDPKARAQWSRWARYRLTEMSYQKLLVDSKGLCAICAQPMTRICVDHEHSTGIVRGLLCHSCNVKLHSVDTWVHLGSALAYLGRKEVAPCAT